MASSILTAYLQYQRDMGVDDIVFESGSDIKKLLAGGGRQQSTHGSAVSGGHQYGAPVSAGGTGGYGVSTQTSARGNAPTAGAPIRDSAGASPLDKLSKLKPVDALDIRKIERKTAPAKTGSARRDQLAGLYRETVNCDKCALSQNKTKVVFGSGSADGKLLIIGDSPTTQDDSAGLPFQGEAGELLEKILGKMSLDKGKDVFATYLQKCRGEGFDKEYAGICRQILDRQIDVIDPKVILIFGQPAANFLLENNDNVEKLRNAEHKYKGKPLVVTYGLQLMLEDTQYRHGAWDDMKKVIDTIGY